MLLTANSSVHALAQICACADEHVLLVACGGKGMIARPERCVRWRGECTWLARAVPGHVLLWQTL